MSNHLILCNIDVILPIISLFDYLKEPNARYLLALILDERLQGHGLG
jgi:hypothetical protein